MDGATKRILAEEDHSAEALFLHRSHKPLDVWRQIRRSGRKAKATGIFSLQHLAKRLAVLRIPIHQQVPCAQEKSIEGIGQIPAALLHPRFVRVDRGARKVNSPARHVHHEQQVIRYQTMLRPDLDGGEVNRPENIPVGLEESLPCGLMLSVRCRLDAVCFENVPDGCVGDPVSKVGERPWMGS